MSPSDKLRMAKNLIDYVAKLIGNVVLCRASDREVQQLKGALDQAIELANEASSLDSNVQLEAGTTCREVIARAHYQAGLTELRLGHMNEAQRCFEKSYGVFPTQKAAHNIALCLYRGMLSVGSQAQSVIGLDGQRIYYSPIPKRMKERKEVKSAFERVLDLNPESDLAIEAGKYLIRLKKHSEAK
ncbi:MAG: hypothetical protein ACXADS_10295 [Candidatus Thorarchaeota archaeon]